MRGWWMSGLALSLVPGCFEPTPFIEPATGTETLGGDGTAATGTHGSTHGSTGGTGQVTTTIGTGDTSVESTSVGSTSAGDASTSTGEMSSSTLTSSEGEESSSTNSNTSSDTSSETNDSSDITSSTETTSETSGDTGSNECMPGESRCLSPMQQQDCSPLGIWEAPQSCVDQTCVGDRCQGECAPEQRRCLGDEAQRCDAGQWDTEDRCDGPGQYCEDGACQQCLPWARQFGSDEDDRAEGIAIDTSGQLYVAGSTQGALVGASAMSLGEGDAFVVKYSPDGAQQWLRQFGTEESDQASSIAIDASDQLYVLGRTCGALPGGGGSTEGSCDLFVRKYDAKGALQRTTQFGSDLTDDPGSIAVDRSGQFHVSGRSDGLFPGIEEGDHNRFFVTKYDSESVFQWTRSIGVGTWDGSDPPKGARVDTSGHVYVAGQLGFGALPGGGGELGSSDAFLIKYNSNGQVQWTRQFGTSDSDFAAGVVVDEGSHAVYVAGSTYGHFPGSASEGTTQVDYNAVNYDAFVTKYDAEGSLQWVKQFGTSEEDIATGIAMDRSGQVFVSGTTKGILPNGGGTEGKQDAFVAKYRPNGKLLEIKQFGSSDDDLVHGIAVEASGHKVYVVGTTKGMLPGGSKSAEDDDAFVQQLCFTKQ